MGNLKEEQNLIAIKITKQNKKLTSKSPVEAVLAMLDGSLPISMNQQPRRMLLQFQSSYLPLDKQMILPTKLVLVIHSSTHTVHSFLSFLNHFLALYSWRVDFQIYWFVTMKVSLLPAKRSISHSILLAADTIFIFFFIFDSLPNLFLFLLFIVLWLVVHDFARWTFILVAELCERSISFFF